MIKYSFSLLFIIILLVGCLPKKKGSEKKFISTLSLIKDQINHVDTSLYSIMKIVSPDSLHNDTTYIPREEFRAAAKEFLEIPDLSDKKIAARFKEETLYDEMLNRVIITYIPENPAKEEIQKMELLVTPNTATGDKVNNIIINVMISDKDGFLQKNMLWQMDKSFQVASVSKKPGQPETTSTMKVTWNEGYDL